MNQILKPAALAALAVSVLAVAACQPDRPAPEASRGDADAGIQSAPAANKPVRGIYSWGAEVESLQPCGQSVIWWADGNAALLAPLHAKADERRAADPSQPYPLIYVEGRGRLIGKADDGFAADYENVLELTEVSHIEAPPPADCRLPEPD